MNHEKFKIVMAALDDEILEEAKQPLQTKRHYFYWGSIAAACFFLVLIIPFYMQKSDLSASDLIAKGYDILVPENADHITYSLEQDSRSEKALATFSLNGDEYIYEVRKTAEPSVFIDENTYDSLMTWNAKGLDLCMYQTDSITSVRWYSTENRTQHTLSSPAEAEKLITTAREVLLLTGLDISHAPVGAEQIQYAVFPYQDLIVAETIFLYKGVSYSYRMAATSDIKENFTDISGLNQTFPVNLSGTVHYCEAFLSLDPGNQGKIIWFDVVPGVLYSLAMDSDASEEKLLSFAADLFKPLQEDIK